MSGPNTAAECPSAFDVIIDGFGYVTARAVDPNMPFRVQQQQLNYTPTFLERTNVSGAYGDDSQSFFLVESQNDWSEGEGQKFFRSPDAESARTSWRLDNLIPSIAGQLKLDQTAPLATSLTTATTAVVGSSLTGYSFLSADAATLWAFNSTSGAWTSVGSHGAGGLNAHGNALAYDGSVTSGVYIGGATALRYWDGATFSTFNARTGLTALAFLNNALYATDASHLYTYDTAGTETTLFTWKTAKGAAPGAGPIALVPFGGQLLILLYGLYGAGPEVWLYDGTATKKLWQLQKNFIADGICVANGIVYVTGRLQSTVSGTTYSDPAIYYFANGTPGLLWRALNPTTTCTPTQIAPYDNGVVWVDTSHATAEANLGRLMYYDIETGAFYCRATLAGTPATTQLMQVASSSLQVVVSNGQASVQFYYPVAVATSGTVQTSFFDFDNSRPKLFRGIMVDFSAATDGNGGSVDIAYQVDSLDGAVTTLQAGATSGTEYALTGVTGHSISVKITVNKGTSTSGPILKRIYVRGVPVLQAYRTNQFILDLCGVNGQNMLVRRDGSNHNLAGEEMRANLAASIKSTTPLTITDITGTYTGVLEPANCEFDMTRPKEWYARIQIREV